MQNQEIVDRLKGMIVKRLALKLPVEEIETDAPLFRGGLNLDSVESLEIVVGMEEEFGITVDEKDNTKERFYSVGTLASYISEQLGGT